MRGRARPLLWVGVQAMHTWKTHLTAVLRRLADTHGDTPLAEIERILAGVFEARTVRFVVAHSGDRAEPLTLRALLDRPCDVVIELQTQLMGLPAGGGRSATGAASRFQPGDAPPAPEPSAEARCDQFIREFARLEQRHEFMWAGYIVRELLPRVGFPDAEAKVVLDRLRMDGILHMTKVPNPKNPHFPATGAKLNRQHPRVIAVLGEPTAADAGPEHPPVGSLPDAPQGEPHSAPSVV